MSATSGRLTVPFLSVEAVSKRYGLTTVLHDVSLDIVPGQCLALVGENGAGKSTLVKIISGVVQPSSGSLRLEREHARFASPRDAQAAGIATIPQELAYVPNMTVAENLLLGRWPHRLACTSSRRIRSTAACLLERLDLDLDPDDVMIELSLAQRQLVEIGKALSADARLVILDEPTASLNGVEADRLLGMLTAMKQRGVALVYVSHRLDECFRLADQIAVLRNGRVASLRTPAETSQDQVVNDMLGREYVEPRLATELGRPDAAAFVKVIDWRTERVPRLRGVSFEAHRGEVLGIFGLVGSGAESIARGLGGHTGSRVHGALELDGRSIAPFRGPAAARRAGVGYVPAERKTDGLALSRPLQEALTVLIPRTVSHAGVVARRRERRLAGDLIGRFGIRCTSRRQAVGELSGGNQQKALLASRLAAGPNLLVLHEPTRGVDVAARSQIHELIVKAARDGAAVVVVTSDLVEAVAVADRLAVIRGGVVVDELRGARKSENAVLMAATAATGSGEGSQEP